MSCKLAWRSTHFSLKVYLQCHVHDCWISNAVGQEHLRACWSSKVVLAPYPSFASTVSSSWLDGPKLMLTT